MHHKRWNVQALQCLDRRREHLSICVDLCAHLDINDINVCLDEATVPVGVRNGSLTSKRVVNVIALEWESRFL